MRQITAQELASALAAARPDPALREFGELVRRTLGSAGSRPAGDEEAVGEEAAGLARTLAGSAGSTHDSARLLAAASALLVCAGTRPELLDGVRHWLARHGPPSGPSSTGPSGSAPTASGPSTAAREATDNTDNTVAGAAVSGSVVQAHTVGAVHLHTAPPAVRPVPHQLPPVPAHFVDRVRDLATLDALLAERQGASRLLVAVTGPAGVGKTALVSRWLTGAGDAFPDGQLYADMGGYSLAGAVRPGEVLGRLLRALGCSQVPAELSEQAALWRTVTTGRRLAIVLDNALSAAQVRPLLPGGTDSVVTVVSRRRLTGLGVDDAVFHTVDMLDTPAAVELLRHRAGEQRVAGEPAAAEEIAVLCAGLPLAVCVAAARMAARPRQSVAGLAGAIARHRLGSFRLEGDAVVESALDESYRSLPDEVARAYRLLGLMPVETFGPHAAAAGWGRTPDEAEALLDELVEASLLEELGPHELTGVPCFRFHDLVRLHAAHRAESEEPGQERTRCVRRVLDWYLATATAARTLLSPSHRVLRRDYAVGPGPALSFDDPDAALNWLHSEGTQLMRAVRLSAERRWDATCWQLVDAMQPWFLRSRPYDLWVAAHRLGLDAARRAGHPEGVSRMLTTGGSGLYNAGLLDEALDWFTRALDDARGRADRRAEAQALHGLGQTHRLAGRTARAAELFGTALALREAIGYRRGAALSRLCLGDVALAEDRPEEARARLALARDELLAEGDRYDAARALAFLGRAHARAALGRPTAPGAEPGRAAAERLLHTAAHEFRAAGSAHWEAHVLEMLGLTAEEDADPATARERYRSALALYRPLSPRDTDRLQERLRALGPPEADTP
ncbi:ATP-binding protein [Streptomyces cacaoi]|uniref:ATP-binding protein n=1 Tax=Streptomyces cacaoi TaxID=1898 RepID=UPI0011F2EC59|nr:tetratricopeptide repeat protein [Streptomyces cacaoi]